MIRFLPTERTRSTVLPLMDPRASLGSTVSNRVTTFPVSASSRVRAMRKIVSPSGIFRDHRAHLISHRRRLESRLGQKWRDRTACHRLVIHFIDQESAPHSVL